MPIVNDPSTFRPSPTLAKLPTDSQKVALLMAEGRAAAAKLKYPKTPGVLMDNAVAAAHFKNLVKQIHPDDFTNVILLDYITQAALVWSKVRFLIEGLADGSIPSTVRGSTGSQVRAPEFGALNSFQTVYQSLLYSAGIKGVNRMTDDDKVKAKVARGQDVPEPAAPRLTGDVHKDKGMMSLLAKSRVHHLR